MAKKFTITFSDNRRLRHTALANERNVVKVSSDVPLERLGPLGCGIQTGAGAVMNALNVRPGTSFASFGAGAVGCSAIMAARAVGATTIIAIDIVPSRLEMAKELGATHTINSKQTDPVEAIRDITGGGVDYSLETSGNPRALHQAIEALGSLGTCGIVGAEPLGTEVSFDVNNLMIPGKSIREILEGESVPDIFIPRLIELNVQGRFPFEKLIKFYSLDQINQAAQDSEKGDTIKPIIRQRGSIQQSSTEISGIWFRNNSKLTFRRSEQGPGQLTRVC